jgi:hypothetical protein
MSVNIDQVFERIGGRGDNQLVIKYEDLDHRLRIYGHSFQRVV